MRFQKAMMAALVCIAAGCTDDSDSSSTEAERDLTAIEIEACAHMTNGPNTAMSLSAEREMPTETEASDWIHQRFDLTLPAADGGFVGYVDYDVTDEGDYLVFLDGPATVTIDGDEPSESMAVGGCDTIETMHIFPLTVGVHVIEVSSPTEAVRLVVEPDRLGEHGDHDHGHGDGHHHGDSHGHGDDDHNDASTDHDDETTAGTAAHAGGDETADGGAGEASDADSNQASSAAGAQDQPSTAGASAPHGGSDAAHGGSDTALGGGDAARGGSDAAQGGAEDSGSE